MHQYSKTLSEGQGSTQRLLKCPTEGCDKVLSSSPGLRYHLKTHEDTRPYSCAKCNKTFKSSNGLKYHTEKTKCEDQTVSSSLMEAACSENSKASFVAVAPATRPTSLLESPKKADMVPPALSLLGASTPDSAAESVQSDTSDNGASESSIPNGLDWLTELANIATGPQSPLIPRKIVPVIINNNLSRSLHSYAKPPPDIPSPTPTPAKRLQHLATADTEFHGSPTPPLSASPKENGSSNENWSYSWPTAVWQCFLKGSRVRFLSGTKSEWRRVEEMNNNHHMFEDSSLQDENYASNGLRITKLEEVKSITTDGNKNNNVVLKISFSSDIPGKSQLAVECDISHPYFVKNKGWSSYDPSLTVEKHGIPCSELDSGDICLPPNHPEAISFQESELFESFKSNDFTPMGSSVVLALSNLARQRRDSGNSSPPSSPIKRKHSSGGKPEPKAGKRPMNAFMLFAKKFRVEYTQMYPGKDNRAISVILGDKWKKLKVEERRAYAQEAKLLADEHKKIHPDCWKRKRTQSAVS